MPVRRALGVRTIFNLLGPLSNPAGARAQVMGVYAAHLVPVAAEAMGLLGPPRLRRPRRIRQRSRGTGRALHLRPQPGRRSPRRHVTSSNLTPEELGLRTAPIETLRGGDAAANAQILRAIFSGEPGPRRDVVLLNAAAVLVTAGLVHPIALQPALSPPCARVSPRRTRHRLRRGHRNSLHPSHAHAQRVTEPQRTGATYNLQQPNP